MNSFSQQLFNTVLKQHEKTSYVKKNHVEAIARFLRDSETGDLVKLSWMHKEWHEFCDKVKYAFIAAPRGHGKSEQIVKGRTLVEIGNNPNIRVKIISGNDELANKRVAAIEEIIEFNKDYQRLYGELKPKKATNWGKTSFTVKRTMSGIKEPTLEGYGITSTGTGDRADLIVLDDIINARNALQFPAMRDTIKQIFWSDIMNWLSPRFGRMIYVCTLWHRDDLSSEIKQKITDGTTDFKMLFYAINRECDSLWPEVWTKEKLLAKQRENPSEFDRAYRNTPISDEDAIFKRAWILNSVRIDAPETIVNDNYKVFVGVDLAISKKSSADWTVIFVMAVHDTLDVRVPLKMIRGRFSSPETARLILNVTKQYKPEMIYVENNAYQKSLLEWMESLQDTDEWKQNQWAIPNVMGFRTGTQKHDPFEGLPSMANEFANGMWVICNHKNPLIEGEEPCSDPNCFCQFIDELSSYPYGKKDDTVMAAWLAREAAKKGGSIFFKTYRI